MGLCSREITMLSHSRLSLGLIHESLWVSYHFLPNDTRKWNSVVIIVVDAWYCHPDGHMGSFRKKDSWRNFGGTWFQCFDEVTCHAFGSKEPDFTVPLERAACFTKQRNQNIHWKPMFSRKLEVRASERERDSMRDWVLKVREREHEQWRI